MVDEHVELVLDLVKSVVHVFDQVRDPERDEAHGRQNCPKKDGHMLQPFFFPPL